MHEEKIVQWKTGKRKDAEKATNTKERTNNRRRLKTKRISHTFGTSWTFSRILHAYELLWYHNDF